MFTSVLDRRFTIILTVRELPEESLQARKSRLYGQYSQSTEYHEDAFGAWLGEDLKYPAEDCDLVLRRNARILKRRTNAFTTVWSKIYARIHILPFDCRPAALPDAQLRSWKMYGVHVYSQ